MKFTIGYHEVEGSLAVLKKPVAILRKNFEVSDLLNTHEESSAIVRSGFEVVGIVRNKYIFKNRPRAMISKPEATKKRRVMTNPFAAALNSAQ